MNERELNEIKEQYAKLGDEDANVIHRLVTEVERLKNLCIIASQTMTVIDEWLGSASTRQAATDSMWRLNRALEQNGFPYENLHILDWRGSILHELNDAGFYPNSDNAYLADTRFVYDPDAPAGKRIFGNAVGPTLKEVVAEVEQLKSENTRLQSSIDLADSVIEGLYASYFSLGPKPGLNLDWSMEYVGKWRKIKGGDQ